ncbi:hypothetical protein BYT27DRAFT_6435477 [Phlegmacium glaucopus]|nr:hypothetical protein BYT27DRAFT_6435477 [Phlegmacium glaucopus]
MAVHLQMFFASKLIHKSQADTEGNELSSHMDLLWSRQYITTTDQRVDDIGNNVPNISMPSSSGGGPIFRTIEGNLTSVNMEHDTIKDSFNNNSVVQSSGKEKIAFPTNHSTAS